MIKRVHLLAVVSVLLGGGIAGAQSSHPMVETIANHVIQKHQRASCQDIAKERSRPPEQRTDMEKRAVQIMRTNPDIRAEFINRVAAPIANKLFECGMLP